VQAYRVDWTGLNESTLLETQEYETTMSYDGLSRPVSVELPEDLDSERKLVVPTYNRSGAMETISLDGEVYVSRIAYNAKGQRVLMAYGNDIMTRFAYDSVNFRLLRQRSEKFVNPSGFALTYEPVSGTVRQDCEYDFDLSGNIVTMTDDSPNAGVGGGSANPLSRDFTYDALYRLMTATGRESGSFANSSTPWDDGFYVPDDSHTNTRGYTRTYTYDQLGNMLKVNHNAGAGNTFNRWFNDYDTVLTAAYLNSNLASKVKYGSTTITNSFDGNGNMVGEGSSRHFEWDYADQMRVYRTQTSGAEPTVFAHYLYDAGGVRVKKIVRKSTGNHEVTVYIDGVFEYLYLVNSSSTKTEEKNEIHVMDGRSRIARREVFGASWTGSQTDAVKYVMEDHLGNASFTLTASGGAYRREEYFPFGETSFGSYGKKRYRFCGKERDEESGLYYYGARYYMPWQCRFVSVDPLAAEYAFYTPYQYAGNQPIIAIDLDGLEPSGGGQENTKEMVTSRTENTDEQSNTRTIVENGFSYRFDGDEIVIHAFSTYETYSGDSLVASGRTESEEVRGNPEDLNDDVKERIQQNESDLDERLIREPIQGIAKGIAAERNVPNRYRLEDPKKLGHGHSGSEAAIKDTKVGRIKSDGKKAGDLAVRWDMPDGKTTTPHRNVGPTVAKRLGLNPKNPKKFPHTPVSKARVKAWRLGARTLHGIGRVAIPIGVVIDALTIANGVIKDGGTWGKNTSGAVGSAAGGWIGAIAGSYLGGIAGSYLGGMIGGPVGAAIGGALGSIIGAIGGSIIGSWLGEQAGEAIHESMEESTLPTRTSSRNPVLLDF
jgi:RHS repeat-associated protein